MTNAGTARVTVVVLFLLITGAAAGQGFQELEYPLESGVHTNNLPAPAMVWSDVVTVPGATSVQVVFDNADLLGESDAVVVSGVADGHPQRLDRTALENWQLHTAWFNGPSVVVSLHLGPGSAGSVTVRRVFAAAAPVLPESICGLFDDRVVTTEPRVCRILASSSTVCSFPATCASSAFLASESSVIVTSRDAVVPPGFRIAEFNVPLSQSNGAILHPPPDDQYPVDRSSIQSSTASVAGDNWAVARLHPDASGQTAAARQGSGFTMATSLPLTGATLRITGFGRDDTPNATRHQCTQTATGPLANSTGGPLVLSYFVDTESGSSGSPVLRESSGEVIGVHTDDGCTTGGGTNSGTSILHATLQNAIQSVGGGCAPISLVSGISQLLNCEPVIFNVNPSPGRWVGVGLTSASDWNISIEGSPGSGVAFGSNSTGGTCDFLLADGHFGAVPPAAGRMRRESGSNDADAEFHEAITVTPGITRWSSWISTRVLRLYEFEITSLGPYRINVTGDASLEWLLFTPALTAEWRPRTFNLNASYPVGTPLSTGFLLSPGWYCIVVCRSGGTALPNHFDLTVTVCPMTATLALPLTTATTITNTCQYFSLTPSPGEWNVVSISSASDWNVALGTGSDALFGNENAFVVADGHAGTISAGTGVFNRASGTDNGVAQHRQATDVGLNNPFNGTSMVAGAVVRIFEFNVAFTGYYDFGVTGGSGDPNLNWRHYTPPNSSAWDGRLSSYRLGDVGGTLETGVYLSPGWHAIVVYLDGGPKATADLFTVHAASAVGIEGLSVGENDTNTASHQPFELSPTFTSRWSAVGANCVATSDCDVHLGTADSDDYANGECEFVIANGNLGTIPALTGVAVRDVGTDPWELERATVTSISPGFVTPGTFPADGVVQVLEFDVAFPGNIEVASTSSSALRWSFFRPGSGSAWRNRASDDDNGTFGVVESVTATEAGTHALVVYRSGFGGTSGINYTVYLTPDSPVPALSDITPSSVLVGSGTTTLTLTGTGFVNGSQARRDGVNITTTYVSPTQLTANVLWPNLLFPGTLDITVFNPSPGGGTSGPQVLSVVYPAPVLTDISPDSAPVGSPAITLTADGSGFIASSVVRWHGLNLTTTFVSATQLTATVPATYLDSGGILTVTVYNPSPGGGTSVAHPFSIISPLPVLGSISPTSATAGQSSPVTITCIGSGFTSDSTVLYDGAIIGSTTYVSATQQVQLLVNATYLVNPGNRLITVENPAPGGGTSASRTLVIATVQPTLSGMSPNSVTAGTASIDITLTGTGFNGTSDVTLCYQPLLFAAFVSLPTTYISATQLVVTVPANYLVNARVIYVYLSNDPQPLPFGGLQYWSAAGPEAFTINNPVPVLTGPTGSWSAAGSPIPSTLNFVGTGLNSQSEALWNGSSTGLTQSFSSTSNSISVQVSPSLQAVPGTYSLTVFNPAPGGGTSNILTKELRSPCLSSVTPAVIASPMTTASPPVVLQIHGSDLFDPGFDVRANGISLVTTANTPPPFGPGGFTAILPPTIPQTQRVGGIVITGLNFGTVPSNQLAIEIEDHSNRGNIERVPLAPLPGEAFSVVMTEGITGAPFTLFADSLNFPPIVGQNSGLVLAVTPGAANVVLDGMAIYSPPNPLAVFTSGPICIAPEVLGPRFVLPGIVMPNPPFGISLTIQAAYVDPSALHGFNLTHARWPFDL